MTPNAALRARNQRLREIRTQTESSASRATPQANPQAVQAVGGMDAGGAFVQYGRVGVDPIAIFRVAEG